MTVTEALEKRNSVRAYLPDEIPRETLAKIFEAAERTPSWANTQAWEVFAASGKSLDAIRSAYAENYKNAVKMATDIPRPEKWPESAGARTRALFPDMQRDCGDDVNQFGALNNALFNAPTVIFLALDKELSVWSLYDLGAYAQSIMLAAAEHGLGTIGAVTCVAYPDVVRKTLDIPDNLNIAIGIAIGKADPANKINNFRSARDGAEKKVRYFN